MTTTAKKLRDDAKKRLKLLEDALEPSDIIIGLYKGRIEGENFTLEVRYGLAHLVFEDRYGDNHVIAYANLHHTYDMNAKKGCWSCLPLLEEDLYAGIDPKPEGFGALEGLKFNNKIFLGK